MDSATLTANEATLNAAKIKLVEGYGSAGVKPSAIPPGLITILLQLVQQFLASGGCTPKPSQTVAETVADLEARAGNHPLRFEMQAARMMIDNSIPNPWQATSAIVYAFNNTSTETKIAFASIDMAA